MMLFNYILISIFFFATMVIFCRNSLYSILSLIIIIVSSCFILFSLKIEFLSFLLLLIYVGGIAVLFLFMVIMLQLYKDTKQTTIFFLSQNYLLCIFLCLKFVVFIYFFNKVFCSSLNLISFEYLKYNKDNNLFFNIIWNTDTLIFLNLFTTKAFLFFILGFTLLFSMIGSIAICLNQKI
jgi:NADH-quinone oxidoreductase subunit J